MKLQFFLLTVLFVVTASIYGENKFIVYTPPKCGTYLIAKTLQLLLEKKPDYRLGPLDSNEGMIDYTNNITKNNGFVIAHNWNKTMLDKLVDQGYHVIFIMRDPRDQIISMQNWMIEGEWYWLNAAKIIDRDDQLSELITGIKYGWRCYDSCVKSRYNLFSSLPTHKRLLVKFENIVGEKGLGNHDAQIQELIDIAGFLDFPLSVEEAEEIANQIFGGTRTFRFGEIGRWKKHFKPLHKDLFKSLYKNDLIDLGYETDYNW